MKRFFTTAIIAGVFGLILGAAPVDAQSQAEKEQVARLAGEVEQLMTDMQTRSEGFPDVLARLQAGEATIAEADETVAQLISQLTEITNSMDDDTEFAGSIDAFVASTVDLIAEAEASNNEAMKGLIPTLETTKEQLEADDARRNEAVVMARNVIRDLERNREAIAFFIKAGAVIEAANLISSSIDDFEVIVERGHAVASGLIEAANP
jgi:ABC-type transporter Mla subunit MlaD